jgi:anaerobic ribonucleoside-triphosphate reductase activating protein
MIRYDSFSVEENEHLYGPGKRLLLFCQGCSLHCKGCVNKHLWDFKSGNEISVEEIISLCDNVDGITLHGGEPLDQYASVVRLVECLKNNGKTVILFTGYMYKELNKIQKKIWRESDIVVSGRYEQDKRNIYLQFRVSTNQKVYIHKGIYKGYKIRDKYTTAILTIDENLKIQYEYNIAYYFDIYGFNIFVITNACLIALITCVKSKNKN